MSDTSCVISTWFVADDESEATYFPQIDSQSNTADARDVYWRCVVVFFASSLAVNSKCRHVMFTNSEPPVVGGLDIKTTLTAWGVEIVRLPITWRLPLGSVTHWGNQFYVFDIMEYWIEMEECPPLIILDSDCIWTRSADKIVEAVEKYGALTYELNYPASAEINGLTSIQLARFVAEHSGITLNKVPYCGGEFIAATSGTIKRIIGTARALWPAVVQQDSDCPREEAHLLSVIYAMQSIRPGTGNSFIKRMWTAFRYNNLSSADLSKTIWHLPAEKRTGFSDLFEYLVANSACDPRETPEAMGLDPVMYSKFFGVPRRSPSKFAHDAARRVRDKVRRRSR